MVRLNITLPEKIAEQISDKRNKSRFIAEAIEEKIKRDRMERIKQLMEEGYRKAFEEDEELLSDWQETELEGWE